MTERHREVMCQLDPGSLARNNNSSPPFVQRSSTPERNRHLLPERHSEPPRMGTAGREDGTGRRSGRVQKRRGAYSVTDM